MKSRKILSALLSLVMVIAIVPARMQTAYAATDAMTAIEEALSEYQVGDTVTVADDGYIGIPVEATTYYDTTKGDVIDKYHGTYLILYVVNTCVERIGTDSDAEIIESMLDRGYAVTVIDYLNNAQAISPDLDWSMIEIRTKLSAGELYTDKTVFPSTTYEEIYTVPAGYDIDPDNVFWELDKHATDGSLERIVEFWNNDFRGCNRDRGYLIKWVHEDGTRKETQNGFDGSAPQWYDEDGTLNNETGEWTYIPYTKAVEVTDPVKLDGSPLDYNMYVTAIYPTNPENEVPVMAFAASSEALAMGLRQRPHFNGFLFRGYAGVTYDYGFVPTEKEVNTYYSNAGTYTGGVTGDNRTYSLQFFNDKLMNTAAIRWIRYVAKTDDRFSKWAADDSLGVYGISKSGWINFLGTSHPEDLPQFSQFVGHHGETRYDNGLTETVVQDGYTIDGAEPQPWQTANGEKLASNVNFIYQSVGTSNLWVTEDFCPTYAHTATNDNTGTWSHYGPGGAAVLEEYDIPSVYLELPIRHDLAHGNDPRNGADGYAALFDTAGYYLKNDAAKVVYITPVNGADDVEDDTEITVQFTGPVAASEITKVKITDSKGNTLKGIWEPSFGNCKWTFNGEAFTGCETYTITVPSTIKGDNGLSLQATATSTFKTSKEADYDALAFDNGDTVYATDAGSYVYFTMPDKSAVSGFTADALKLRFKVTNDAANAVEVYGVTSLSKSSPASSVTGALIDTVYLRSDGFYEVDISDYVEDIPAGTEVAFFIKTAKTPGETVIREPDLSVNKGGLAINSSTDCVWGIIPGTSIYGLSSTLGPQQKLSKDDYQEPDYSNKFYDTRLYMSASITPYTTSVPEDWYGRRFHVELGMLDAGERSMNIYTTSRNTQAFADYDWNMYNFLTKPNEEINLEFDYQVYKADIGQRGKGLFMDMTATGDPEMPLYFTNYKVTEIVTDVEIGEASIVVEDPPLILDTEYGTIPEQYKSVEQYPFVLFNNANKSFVKAYSVDSVAYESLLYEIFHNMRGSYKSGYTLLMRRDYTHTAGTYPNHTFSSTGNTIDLGGYTLSCPDAVLFNMTSASVTTGTAPATTGYTVKNGKIAVTNQPVMTGYMYKGGDGKTYDMDFEDIEFVYASGATVTSPVISYTECNVSDYKEQVGTYNITFTDCKFNFKNNAPSGTLTMFGNGSADGTLVGNVTVTGGDITSNNDIQITANTSADGTITFVKDTDGNYTTASVLTGKTLSGGVVTTADGTRGFRATSTSNGYDNYIVDLPDMTDTLMASLTSSNNRVVVGANSIAVFSHPTNSSYQISSDALVSALTADTGWTLSYVNSSKVEATSTHVKSGYIKATHSESKDIYIPITAKGAVIDNDHSDNAATLNGTAKATYSYADGVGTFTAGATAIDGYAFTGIGAGTGQAGAIERKPYTIAFKVKTTGDATGSINWRWDGDGFEFLKFNAVDGKFTYRTSSGMVEGGSFANDVWHDVVVVYDQPINTYQIWIDGAYIANTAAVPGSDASHYSAKVDFCIATGSVNGTVSYKDFDTHYGYYYAPFTPTATYLLGTMTSDNSYVVVGTDAVSVLSHPTDATYQVSSTALVSALSVEDGWTLTYVDANKNTATTDHVTAGYLKASHSDYDDIYIPISAKGDDIANNIGTTATHKGSVKATYSYSDGVVTFTAGETALDGYSLTGIGAGAGTAGAIEQLPYTMKFKVKLTGDAVGAVNMRWENDGNSLLKFNADETFLYQDNKNTLVGGGKFKKDVWHDVVLVYDPANKYQIWVDGKCRILDSKNVDNGYYAKIVFAMATDSKNGTISYKDFDAYYGYYSVVEGASTEIYVPAEDIIMSQLAKGDVYEKDGVEYVFVAVTTPSAFEISEYNTFVCTDGDTVKAIAVSDLVTTRVTGEVEIAVIVKNVLSVNADNFKATITATEIDDMVE